MHTVWMDRIGGTASAACALHCLTMSFAPALVSALGLSFLATEASEWALFSVAVAFALLAATQGFRTHRTLGVLAGFGAGILLLVTGRMAEAFALFEGGGKMAIAGGLVLVVSHISSMRCAAACQADCDCP